MNKLTNHADKIRRNHIISIQINLLNRCTSKCKYCKKYTWPNDELDVKVVKRTLYYLHSKGLQTVVFSGGDPILYKNIKEVISYCKELGIETSIITSLITNNVELLEYLAENVDRIHCSVDAANRDLYKELRGVDGLKIVQNNLKLVNDIRVNFNKSLVRISSTISNKNFEEIYNLYLFAKKTNSTLNYYFIHEHKDYFMNEDETAKFKINLEKVLKHDVENITNAYGILNNNFYKEQTLVKSKYCTIPYIHCLINANGDIYPCCKLLNDNGCYGPQLKYVYGNIYNENLDFEFSKRFKNYDICNYCNGCEERYCNIIDEVNEIHKSKDWKLYL